MALLDGITGWVDAGSGGANNIDQVAAIEAAPPGWGRLRPCSRASPCGALRANAGEMESRLLPREGALGSSATNSGAKCST